MKENDVAERSTLPRRRIYVLSGELMPLLELEWRLENAFTWTVTKLQRDLTLSWPEVCTTFSLAARLMAILRSLRIVVGRLRLEKLTWGANDVGIYRKFHFGQEKVYEVQNFRTRAGIHSRKSGSDVTPVTDQHNQTIHCHCAYLDSSQLPPSQASQRQMSLSNVECRGAEDIERQQRRARNLRDRVRFRVLIIGRANAGKTTILQRVCNTTEQPKIFSRDGHEVFHVLDIITYCYWCG